MPKTVTVALRKESVDRNRQNYDCFEWIKASLSARRAWIEIGWHRHFEFFCPSLSARRAWIEILLVYLALIRYLVALRKESVDRNCNAKLRNILDLVALRKESVDRNTSFYPASLCDLPSLSARRAWIEINGVLLASLSSSGRSPQGERG